MNEALQKFRDELALLIERMDGVASADVIAETKDFAIGVDLEDGPLIFVNIQPA